MCDLSVVKGIERNWINLVHECEQLFGKKYHVDDQEYTFFGLVHSADDFYYGMCDKDNKVLLLSCVGNLHDYEKDNS